MTREEHPDAVFHHAAVGLVLSDVEGRIINVNKALCELTGYARAEIIGRLHSDFVHPDFKMPTPDFKRLIDGEIDSYDREKLWVRKDGASFWALVTVSLQNDVTGETVRTINVIRDITEQKSLQEKLRESEAQFRSTFDNAAVGITHADLDRKFIRVNRKFCDITGYTEDELIGKDTFNITVEEDRITPPQFVSLYRGEATHAEMEKRYVHRDKRPEMAVVLLSAFDDDEFVREFLKGDVKGKAYLLKQSLDSLADLVQAVKDVSEGKTYLASEIVAKLAGTQNNRESQFLSELTDREREVLDCMARGLSNSAIAEELYIQPRTVERHIGSIFSKMRLQPQPKAHARVQAVLAYLQDSGRLKEGQKPVNSAPNGAANEAPKSEQPAHLQHIQAMMSKSA